MGRWRSSPSCGKCLRVSPRPRPRDSNCILLSWTGWSVSCDTFSLSIQPHPRLPLSPLPWGSDSYDPAYTGRTRTAIYAPLQHRSPINWPSFSNTHTHTLNASQGFTPLSTLPIFSAVRLRPFVFRKSQPGVGEVRWLNDSLLPTLYPDRAQSERQTSFC